MQVRAQNRWIDLLLLPTYVLVHPNNPFQYLLWRIDLSINRLDPEIFRNRFLSKRNSSQPRLQTSFSALFEASIPGKGVKSLSTKTVAKRNKMFPGFTLIRVRLSSRFGISYKEDDDDEQLVEKGFSSLAEPKWKKCKQEPEQSTADGPPHTFTLSLSLSFSLYSVPLVLWLETAPTELTDRQTDQDLLYFVLKISLTCQH